MTRSAIASCAGLLDVPLLAAVWDAARQVAEGDGAQVWIHTDLQPGNLLIADARLAGVLDWGGLAIGDPAVDLIVAWNLLEDKGRAAFRDAADVDQPTWNEAAPGRCRLELLPIPTMSNQPGPGEGFQVSNRAGRCRHLADV